MLDINNLSFLYTSARAATLERINIKIQNNEVVAIVGPNGSGKTTLAYCLCGIIPHLIKGKMDGNVIVDGKNTREHPFQDIIKDIGIIFQDPDAQFVTLRVKDEIAFGLENTDLSQIEIDACFYDVVERFGLSDLLNNAPQDLSMGQKQKVALASVIAMKPKILLLDEPASTLDPRGQRRFLETIRSLRGCLTIIMLTHNFEYVRTTADRVIVIHGNTVKFDGSPNLLTRKDVLTLFGVNDDKKEKRIAHPKERSLIQVDGLSYRYARSRKLSLDDVSFMVNKSEILGIVGPNGCGKSTLLFLMHGLLKPRLGRVLIDGRDVSMMDFPELAVKQGILFQNPNHQIFTPSIEEELSFGLKNLGLNEEVIEKRIEMASSFFNFEDLLRDPYSLSYGQRKLLSLATVLVMDPDIILLDEPELGLDIGFRDKFEKTLLKLNQSGKTFVIASHDLDMMEDIAHKIVFLEKGRVIMWGPAQQIIQAVRDYFDR